MIIFFRNVIILNKITCAKLFSDGSTEGPKVKKISICAVINPNKTTLRKSLIFNCKDTTKADHISKSLKHVH